MSVSLVIRKSGLSDQRSAWSVQLRYHDLSGVDYHTIARVSEDVAREIIRAGGASWLYGDPDDGKQSPKDAEYPEIAALLRRRALLAERAELRSTQKQMSALADTASLRVERLREIEGELTTFTRVEPANGGGHEESHSQASLREAEG